MFTPFLTIAFWYWLYNQLFFLVGSLAFVLVLFVTGLMQLGALDTVFSFIIDIAVLRMLYRWFGRFYWRSAHYQQKASPGCSLPHHRR